MTVAGSILAESAQERAQASPDAIAFLEPDGRHVSFGAVFAEAQAVASGLRTLGLEPGDTISFQLPNWREAVAVNLAAAMLGLRVNPITPIYREAELRMILQDCGSKLIFIPHAFRSQDFARMFEDLRPELPALRHVLTVRHSAEPGRSYEWLRAMGAAQGAFAPLPAPAETAKLVLYTSGTTGRAKGAIHTHASIQACLAGCVEHWRMTAKDAVLMASPVTHITGYLFALELPFHCGSPALLTERWDPNAALELIDGFGLTTAFGATPFLKELLDAAEQMERRLPTLRLFPCGGASVPPELIRRAFRVTERCRAFRIYGATEAPMVTKGFLEDDERDLAAETDGRVTGYEVKITGADGRAPPPDEAGELRVRGPAMFAGYTDPDETAKALDDEGFFHTGDLGVLRDGAIVVTGRLKDLIIRGGENLSPVEIENALERHPAVGEAAVVAAPHPRLGEGVAAFLRAAPSSGELTVQEVAAFLDGLGLARQKFPERVEYLPDFPRTASGKVRKDLLRETLRRA
jgi:acyl-CoA synthetase (AMP-forming)/AMP-acid ligase II